MASYWVEMEKTQVSEIVPEGFTGADGIKTWADFADCTRENATHCLRACGEKIDEHNNRNELSASDLAAYQSHFGAENIYDESNIKPKIASDYPSEE